MPGWGLRHAFPDHDCQTARYAGLRGLSNGKLLRAAEDAGFDMLITLDRNVQQTLLGRSISIVALNGRTTSLEDLLPLVPLANAILCTIKPGQVVAVDGRAPHPSPPA